MGEFHELNAAEAGFVFVIFFCIFGSRLICGIKKFYYQSFVSSNFQCFCNETGQM